LKKRTAYERLKKYRGIIDRDIDYKQELKSALDEKYGSVFIKIASSTDSPSE
jgi:hypothetical protein